MQNTACSAETVSKQAGSDSSLLICEPASVRLDRGWLVVCLIVQAQALILRAEDSRKLEQNKIIVQLGELWHPTDRLFTQWNGLVMHPTCPFNWLQRFCERENLPFRGLHSFRHAFATEMITSGQIDIKTVSSILGHSDVSTTLDIYTHEVQSASAKAMDFVTKVIDEKRKQA